MNGRGEPSNRGLAPQQDNGYWADSFDASTDWFTPVQPTAHTAVGVLDNPETQELNWISDEHPSFPAGALEITAADVYEALGPDAEDMLAEADVDVEEVISLLNAETVVLPPLDFTELDEPEAQAQPVRPDTQHEALTVWKRRFLKGAVAGVLLSLTGTGGVAAAMDKSVTVDVDGHEKTVSTYDNTVGEVLQEEGVKVGPHDALSPSLNAPVRQDDKITLDKGRLLKLNIDGDIREEWVRSGSVGQALSALHVDTDGAWLSADRNAPVPEQGMELKVRTQKDITVFDGGAPKQISTHAANVDELVKELKLNLGPQDKVTPGGDAKIVNGAQIHVDRITSKVVSVTVPIDPPTQQIVDPNMFKGEEQVVDPGDPGQKIQFTRVTTMNGKEDSRDVVDEKVTKQPKPKIVKVGGKEAPNSGVWDKLVQCEATGNWAMNSGNGYYGGLQFDKGTWDAFGGDQYAPYPHQASREQQIAIAEKVKDSRGGSYGAWPACAAKLGLDS